MNSKLSTKDNNLYNKKEGDVDAYGINLKQVGVEQCITNSM